MKRWVKTIENRVAGPLLVKLMLGAGALVGAQPAVAGGFTACEQPFIFEGSAANIVPLEYTATSVDLAASQDERMARLQETAQRLSWLFKLDSWHQPTYGSLGVVSHMFLGRPCHSDEVLGQLLVGGSGPPVRQGQILIMLQGRIFIEDEQIFIQSRVRGFRRQSDQFDYVFPMEGNFASENLSVSLDGSEDRLFISLPVLDVTFAPRVVSEELFNNMNAAFIRASKVFPLPNEAMPGENLVFHADQPQAFSVRITNDPGWIEVENIFGGQPSRGFIRVSPEASRFLHRSLPELDFVNGVLGFLRLQQARNSLEFAPTPESAWRQTANALSRYLGNELTADEPEARALAHGMIGFVLASHVGDWPGARKAFLRAAELSPTDSHYRNALGVTDTVLCCSEKGAPPYRDPARWFADAVSVDPQNGEALGNLLQFLEFLAATEMRPEGVDTTNLPRTLDVVRKVAEQNSDLLKRDRN